MILGMQDQLKNKVIKWKEERRNAYLKIIFPNIFLWKMLNFVFKSRTPLEQMNLFFFFFFLFINSCIEHILYTTPMNSPTQPNHSPPHFQLKDLDNFKLQSQPPITSLSFSIIINNIFIITHHNPKTTILLLTLTHLFFVHQYFEWLFCLNVTHLSTMLQFSIKLRLPPASIPPPPRRPSPAAPTPIP